MRKRILSYVLAVSMLFSMCAAMPLTAAAAELPSATNVGISGIAGVGQTLAGEYDFNGSSEGGTTFRWLRVSSIPSLLGRPNLVFTTNNVYGVMSDPTGPMNPAVFEVTDNTLITEICNYHYNTSDTPGTISLQESDGTTYGPWDAVINGYWCVYPNITIPAGTYTIIDSKPDSWSFNAQSGYAGMTEVAGYTEISGETEQNYRLQSDDMGKSVIFEVTPKDTDGNTGITVMSNPFGPIPMAVAKIDGFNYATLDDAIAAATDGDTITLLDDIDYAGNITLTDIDLILDLDTFTLNIGCTNSDGALKVDGATLAIDDTGGGEFNIINGYTGVRALNGGTATVSSISGLNGYGIIAESGGSVTVTDNISVLSNMGCGLHLNSGGSAIVYGNIYSLSGIVVSGTDAVATVHGNIYATSGTGISTNSGGTAVVYGNVEAGFRGVLCGNAGGSIHVYGYVIGSEAEGAYAYSDSDIVVEGYIRSKRGLYAYGEGTTILAKQDVITTDSSQYGATSLGGGLITIEGHVNAVNFALVGETAMAEEDGVLEGRYIVYTDGESTVRTRGIEFFKDQCDGALTDHWSLSDSGWSFTSSLACPTAIPHSGSQVAKFGSFAWGVGYQARMYLNKNLNLSAGTNYWLEFWMYHDIEWGPFDDQVTVQISINGGENWTDLATYHRVDGSEGWEKKAIDLSAYAGSTDILIGFLGISGNGNNIYLDDISVSHECIIDGCTVTEAYGGFVSSRDIAGETYYEVTSAEQLAHISDHLDLNYIQTADIDLSMSYSMGWTPIGGFGDPNNYCAPNYFTGKYLGNGFEIQNLSISFNNTEQNTCNAGIFAYVDGADALISDLTVTVAGVNLTCYNYPNFGTIASSLAGGTIRNCDVIINGDIITNLPNGEVGGIAARAWSSYDNVSGTVVGAIEDCTVTLESGSILTEGWLKHTGGIVGFCNMFVSDCDVMISEGECIRSSFCTGGIAGFLGKYSSITGCTVTGAGSIEAYPQKYYSQFIGGIAGIVNEAAITDCVNEVTIDATGILEIAQEQMVYAGGIVGEVCSSSTIAGCKNTADVQVEIANNVVDYYENPADPIGIEHAYAGGIAGYVYGYSRTVTIENCENSANISAVNRIPTLRAYAGGIAGHLDSANGDYAGVIVLNCANRSDKTVYAAAATTMAGGLVGSTTYTDFTTPNILVQNCYNEAVVFTECNGPAAPDSHCIGVTAGGLIGAAGEVTVNYCYSNAPDISAVSITNDDTDNDTDVETDDEVEVIIYGDAYEGGLFGLLYNTAASQNYCEKNENILRATGAIVKGMSIVAEEDQAGAYERATAVQLKTKSFYGSGWSWYTSGGSAPDYYSSSNPWRMTAANTYPVLKGEVYTEPTTPGDGGITVTYYSITASAGSGGSIDPSGKISVQKYQSKTFTITPEPGYIIADVLVDGVSVGAVSEYTFSSVTEDHKIEASFEHPSSRFFDVDGQQWYREGIDFVLMAGLFNGTSETTFEPNTVMTRAMLVTVLWRLDNEPDSTITDLFSDIASGIWYTKAVAWAAENGIVEGYDADTFGPSNPITREQMAAILYRYAGYKGYDVTAMADLSVFDDADDISYWALKAMKWAAAEGLITGTSGTKLDPKGNASRAQVATILMRFVKNIVK